eukprot:6028817-Amphidinium_carterae.2
MDNNPKVASGLSSAKGSQPSLKPCKIASNSGFLALHVAESHGWSVPTPNQCTFTPEHPFGVIYAGSSMYVKITVRHSFRTWSGACETMIEQPPVDQDLDPERVFFACASPISQRHDHHGSLLVCFCFRESPAPSCMGDYALE